MLELTDHRVISSSVKSQFDEVREHIKDLPIYDSDTFMKIQAFEWLITATSLVHGDAHDKQQEKEVEEVKVYSLSFWESLYKQHENYLKVLPMLEEHPIIQNILWEID